MLANRKAPRRRRYVSRRTLILLKPLFRYSERREAYVLRLIGRRVGPVLKRDRRHEGPAYRGPERRGHSARGIVLG